MSIRSMSRIALAGVFAFGAAGSPDEARAGSKKSQEAVHAEIGAPAPDFTLVDTEGNTHRLSDYTEAGKIVVLEWFNPDCPFVQKHHQKSKTMAKTHGEFQEKEVVWLAINSGAPGKQGHGLERNAKARKDFGIEYPVLLDEDGTVGRLYEAKTTPHMYLISSEGTLLYRGAIDDNRSPGKLGKTNYVAAALTSVFAEEKIAASSTKPYGCSVKYGKALP